MMNQENRVVITGATGGIGSCLAEIFDKQGYTLLITGRNKEKLNLLEKKMTNKRHTIVEADLNTSHGIDELIKNCENFQPSGLINCLGVNTMSLMDDLSAEAIIKIINTNLLAPIMVCKAIVPFLKIHSNAFIVNVGSILGSIGYAGMAAYCASKFGLRGFTQSLRRELHNTNIKVIYFAPRSTSTDLNSDAIYQMNHDLGVAIDDPKSVAQKLFDCLHNNKFSDIYVGWPESFFVKLNSILPSVVDKSLAKQLPLIQKYCMLDKK